mgnify:CR=1 FL=1
MKRARLLTPKFITAVVFLLLVALVWFVGSSMGLKTSEARFGLIFLLMLLWVLTLMIGKALADRSSQLLERMVRRDADAAVIGASPEKRAEMAQLRKRLLGAIDILKSSNLGKTRGRSALYELPWYMILGHPAAGKSCAILNSGLKFPLAGKGSTSVQGIGGTRDCDWFFSTEGVLLDTAGRYATQREDRLEWIAFLKLLKKHRSRAPINGIIVAASLPELQKAHTEAFSAYARQIRQRIHEVEDIFGLKVPVYILFTKMDLLAGFTEFFQEFSEDERKQVWGATLAHEQGVGFDAIKVVSEEFELLARGLSQTGTERLAHSRSNISKPALFAFPLEFNNLKASVIKLFEQLVAEDPYHARPLIRGFYFSSALQSGEPSLAMTPRIVSQFALSNTDTTSPVTQDSRTYFLESLFRKVLFPDRFLVGRGGSVGRSRQRVFALLAGMAGLILLVGAWTYSFLSNQKLAAECHQELTLATNLLRGHQPASTSLRALQLLQARIELLRRYRLEGAPWGLRWGLYRGDDLEQALLLEYNQHLHRLMLQPIRVEIEGRLEAFLAAPQSPVPPTPSGGEGTAMPNGYDTNYTLLKTYLMLHDTHRMDASHLADQLPRYWAPWIEGQANDSNLPELRRAAERTVAFYVAQIKEPGLPTISNRSELVANVRSRLAGNAQFQSPYERIYTEIKARGNTRHPAISVGSILENRDMDIVAGSSTLAGSFTLGGWNGYIKAAIQDAAQGKFDGTDWVLASSLDNDLTRHGKPAENEAKLMSLYKADYAREWTRFLTGIAIMNFDTPEKAAEALGRLGDLQRSPIRLIFARAALETSWDNPSQLAKGVSSVKDQVIAKTAGWLGPAAPTTQDPTGQYGEVGGQFAFLGTLTSTANGRAPIESYLELLTKLKTRLLAVTSNADPGAAARQLMQATLGGSGSELAEAQIFVDNTMLASASLAGRDMVRPLLMRPLTQSCQSLVPLAEQELNRAWTQQVLSQWNNLSGKYPFADSTNDAAMADIVRFLKPGEGTLPKFVSGTLGPLLTRRGDTLIQNSRGWPEVRLNSAVVASISRLMQAAESTLQDGDVCRFELQATPTPRIRETLVEIDGRSLVYRNGVETWTEFSWPAHSPSQGARIQVVSNEGASALVVQAPGRLSLLRLLDQAKVDSGRGGTTQLEWRFRVPQSFSNRSAKEPQREDYHPNPIRLHFRVISGPNPLKLSPLRHHTLPARLTH